MYTGSLWLDYEEETHYSAEISRCFLHDDVLVIEFSGADEGHKFTGSCTLRKENNSYTGPGKFAYEGNDAVPSTVSLKLENNGTDIGLHGTWQDQGDDEPYQLEAELRETNR